jgi:hypothetical protein
VHVLPPASVQTGGSASSQDGSECTGQEGVCAEDIEAAVAGCESNDDCEGDDMVCASSELGEVDQDHETWSQEAEDVATAFLPIKACASLEECEAY